MMLEDEVVENTLNQKIVEELRQALENDSLLLPSLPDVAIKIREAIEDEENGAREIVEVINMDPSITAKIIKTANSAMFMRGQPVQDCLGAYSRLGAKTVMQLVISYALKEVFKAQTRWLDERMKDLWQHSLEIASISFVISTLTPGTEPSKTMLAGLLHDIGAIAVLNNVGEHTKALENPEVMDELIDNLRAEFGAAILEKWEFHSDFIKVAKCSEDWQRDAQEQADMSDVINMAHLHAFIGTPMQQRVPRIDGIPAFKKMALGELTPSLSLDILEESAEKVSQIRNLLTG